MNLWDTRTEYDRPSLDDTHTPERPHQLFEQWMQAALDAQLPEANAMTLSTLNTSGFPTARIVLLRAQHEDRFTFFTNYHSNKGKELAQNPQCSALFFWPSLERQIRISGVCTPVSESESGHYFASRPYGVKLARGLRIKVIR
ncbi:MAG: pyridoxal 5'-phosphate synthase [Gammaproteobacteria bacterium]